MKKLKKYGIIAGVTAAVVLGAVCVGSVLLKDKNVLSDGKGNYAILQKNSGLTEEEKMVRTQAYLENSVEESLQRVDFASEEEKEQYRQMLLESFSE